MNTKVFIFSLFLSFASLLYIFTHPIDCDYYNKKSSFVKNISDNSLIIKEAHFYGINSNFFEKSYSKFSDKDSLLNRKAKFWGINIDISN